MLRTDLLSIIRSLNTVFTATGICHTSYIDCLKRGQDGVTFRPSQQTVNITSMTNLPVAVNTVLRLLRMESKSVRSI